MIDKKIEEFSNYYSNTFINLESFKDTISYIRLHEKDNADAIFGKVSLNLLISHSKSIEILLKNNSYIETLIIVRNIFELFVKNYWIYSSKDFDEKFERICELEGKPLNDFEKELVKMEEDLNSNNPVWSKEFVIKFRNMLNSEKLDKPFLVNEENEKFKTTSEGLRSMFRDETLSLKYYHIYRWVSIFCHPTPFLKNIYLMESSDKQSEEEIISEPLFQTLSYGLVFIRLIIIHLIKMFNEMDAHNIDVRNNIHDNILKIVNDSNNNYYTLDNSKQE